MLSSRQDRRITGNNLHLYIDPQREIDQGAQEVHGITGEFLAGKPLFADIADELVNFLSGAELVIHNAPFDVGFLNHEFKRLGSKYSPIADLCAVVDSSLHIQMCMYISKYVYVYIYTPRKIGHVRSVACRTQARRTIPDVHSPHPCQPST